ncbi:Aspartic proteinase-like protein 1 [Morella rubra]|uniref:Aspartic proteinase-like protein 1 n=1 Tax=Morella rubra TaxID=262757 RepID=A0A6A1UND2_9ROSI|nr:Aspartic proteinase-like protein 1 [Morella rubra]
MAWHRVTSTRYSSTLFVLFLALCIRSCHGLGSTFGFDIHHRFSDVVTGILGVEGLPEKGSLEYYVAMAHRDHFMRGRFLAATNNQSPPLAFSGGNETYFFPSLGHLYYASVSVGTPSSSFLVALDTGSDLFWLPCNCHKGGCKTSLELPTGTIYSPNFEEPVKDPQREVVEFEIRYCRQVLKFNTYSPESSTTSQMLPCSSPLCTTQCHSVSNACAYQVEYASANTSSGGVLVADVLHLVTDDGQSKAVDPQIILGCGEVQTGLFLGVGAPNGLFGLGMGNISVPSILAAEEFPNAFVMCFAHDGPGRISFGNNGSSGQGETPFDLGEPSPSYYHISMTQINVGSNSSVLGVSAIFDTGASFTSLSDPAYTFISESFNSQVEEKRLSSNSRIPFEYCYVLSANQTTIYVPDTNLTMESGAVYSVSNPTVVISVQGHGDIYCLAIFRSQDINVIGQNFMTNYNLVFDRDRMVLGWTWTDNCYTPPASSPSKSPAVPPPPPAVSPQTPTGSGNKSHTVPLASTPPPPPNDSPKLKPVTCALIIIILLLSFSAIV